MHPTAQRLYKAASDVQDIMTPSELARLLQESPQTLKNWESRGVSKAGILNACDKLGINPQWLQSGTGRMKPESIRGGRNQVREPAAEAYTDFVPVARGSLRLAAGVSGFAIEYENMAAPPIFFRREWFQSRGIQPEALLALKVSGRSMEPGLFDSDVVVVNTADQVPVDGEVSAVNFEGELVIKRLKRDGGEWWLASDNPDKGRYPDKRCVDGVFIVGRVIHKQSERI